MEGAIMAATAFIDIDNSSWTEISAGTTEGFITNNNDRTVFFLIAESLPDPATVLKGHRLNPADSVNYAVAGAEAVYCRSEDVLAVIVVTPT